MRKRNVYSYEQLLDSEPEQIFPLLCPVREYEWIPQWHCDMIYSQSGVAELGCVFTTDFGDEFGHEVWVVCTYVPLEKIGFVRTGKQRTSRYDITLQPSEGGTRICWRQEITALDPSGDGLLEKLTQQRFDQLMKPLNKMLAHYLETGKQLPLNLKR